MEELMFKLKTPITFEGVEYKEFDLSKLEDLSGQEYADLLKQSTRMEGESLVPEKGRTFAFLAAAKVTSLPYDLFVSLKGRDAARLRYIIGGFFLAED